MGTKSRLKRERLRHGCYVCGRAFTPERPPTQDHVIPRCWFPRPLPKNLPTCKACSACNGSLSEREERLRNLFSRMHAQEPAALAEVYERASRSARPPPPIIGEMLHQLDSGLFVRAKLAPVNYADIHAVFRKIARKLFFIEYGRPLPQDLPLVVTPLTTEAGASVSSLAIRDWKCKVHWVGEALAWVNAVDGDHPEDGLWLFLPLHAAVTAVSTGKVATIALPAAELAVLQ